MELRQRQADFESCCGSRRMSSSFNSPKSLHRIATILEQEGVSMRTMGDRLGKTEMTARKESHQEYDMTLSELYQWQKALSVPISELLVESESAFSPPVKLRTRLLKMMRTVRSIQENSSEDPVQTMAKRLTEQLLELMPELKEVTAWPAVGQIRKSHEIGAVACNTFSDRILNFPTDGGDGI